MIMICHKGPHELMSSIKKTIKNVLRYFKMYLIRPPPTSRIKNATLRDVQCEDT